MTFRVDINIRGISNPIGNGQEIAANSLHNKKLLVEQFLSPNPDIGGVGVELSNSIILHIIEMLKDVGSSIARQPEGKGFLPAWTVTAYYPPGSSTVTYANYLLTHKEKILPKALPQSISGGVVESFQPGSVPNFFFKTQIPVVE